MSVIPSGRGLCTGAVPSNIVVINDVSSIHVTCITLVVTVSQFGPYFLVVMKHLVPWSKWDQIITGAYSSV